MIRFDVKFNACDQRFVTDMHVDRNVRFEAGFEALQVVTINNGGEIYRGAYEVTPRVDEQILPTAQKLMTDDVTVRAIPIYNVTNNSGGSTVYIAREV